ncbi:hypothetical protein BC943DRAFT_269515, partial [Umbelopsis sp. AD052]
EDNQSDGDTIDREVAAATAKVGMPHHRSKPRSDHSSRQKSTDNTTRLRPVAERALENLQTDVTALTEQIDILRRGMIEKEMKRKAEKWTWGWLFKTTAKHAVVNLIILTVIFLFLMKRKSPIAYAVIAYLGPWWNDIFLNFVR